MTDLERQIAEAATTHQIPPGLLAALVDVESGGDPWAYRMEPAYRWVWNCTLHRPFRRLTLAEASSPLPPTGFRAIAGSAATEWTGQRMSWGLVQIMGALARERGYREPYLTSLCDPVVNLDMGAAHLASLLIWASGDLARALGAYNAGKKYAAGVNGRRYAEKVLSALEKLSGNQ